jgi:hypothetical protein
MIGQMRRDAVQFPPLLTQSGDQGSWRDRRGYGELARWSRCQKTHGAVDRDGDSVDNSSVEEV